MSCKRDLQWAIDEIAAGFTEALDRFAQKREREKLIMSKMEDAARKCEETLSLYWPDAEPIKSTTFEWPDAVEDHIRWMCQQIPSLPRGKADRWLGFVQGWLWERGYTTVEGMREWNRGLDDE